MRTFSVIACCLSTCLLLAACGPSQVELMQETEGGTTAIASENGQRTLGVNSYLWHASLDTLSFMPLASADPFGGVIITEWSSAVQVPDERMKVTVYIMDRRLRADGVKVAVFRQVRQNGVWADAPVTPETAAKLTDAILTRARELRLATTPPKN
jgi:hypothetical protein